MRSRNFRLQLSRSKSTYVSPFRVFGMFVFMRPVFILKDVETVKQVTVQGFDHFINRDKTFSKNGDALFSKSLLHLLDNPWREMRHAL